MRPSLVAIKHTEPLGKGRRLKLTWHLKGDSMLSVEHIHGQIKQYKYTRHAWSIVFRSTATTLRAVPNGVSSSCSLALHLPYSRIVIFHIPRIMKLEALPWWPSAGLELQIIIVSKLYQHCFRWEGHFYYCKVWVHLKSRYVGRMLSVIKFPDTANQWVFVSFP